MNYILVTCGLIFLISASAFGQNGILPDILKPDAFAESEAERLGAGVFKILPRGTYENPVGTYKDEENPIGVRQGGSYYSFSTRSHSYNKIPQIELQQGAIQVGFYGANYGLMTDLGDVSLTDITDSLPATVFLLAYVPPKLYSVIVIEHRRTVKIESDGLIFAHMLPAAPGHTYLLRAISFDEADKLVAIRIISQGKDGSLMIAWRSIKDFEVPRMMRQTEDELRAKIVGILDRPEYSDVKSAVKDDVVTLSGSLSRQQASRLLAAINGARPGKLVNQITIK